jgi:hypothetical protein
MRPPTTTIILSNLSHHLVQTFSRLVYRVMVASVVRLLLWLVASVVLVSCLQCTHRTSTIPPCQQQRPPPPSGSRSLRRR